jgi:hypothetical protein
VARALAAYLPLIADQNIENKKEKHRFQMGGRYALLLIC